MTIEYHYRKVWFTGSVTFRVNLDTYIIYTNKPPTNHSNKKKKYNLMSSLKHIVEEFTNLDQARIFPGSDYLQSEEYLRAYQEAGHILSPVSSQKTIPMSTASHSVSEISSLNHEDSSATSSKSSLYPKKDHGRNYNVFSRPHAEKHKECFAMLYRKAKNQIYKTDNGGWEKTALLDGIRSNKEQAKLFDITKSIDDLYFRDLTKCTTADAAQIISEQSDHEIKSNPLLAMVVTYDLNLSPFIEDESKPGMTNWDSRKDPIINEAFKSQGNFERTNVVFENSIETMALDGLQEVHKELRQLQDMKSESADTNYTQQLAVIDKKYEDDQIVIPFKVQLKYHKLREEIAKKRAVDPDIKELTNKEFKNLQEQEIVKRQIKLSKERDVARTELLNMIENKRKADRMASSKLDDLKEHKEILNCIILMVHGLQAVLRTFSSILVTTIKKRSGDHELHNLCNRTIVLAHSGRRSINGLKEGDVTAVLQNLAQKYKKTQLWVFFRLLLDSLEPLPHHIVQQDPERGYRDATQMIRRFEDTGCLGFFNVYLFQLVIVVQKLQNADVEIKKLLFDVLEEGMQQIAEDPTILVANPNYLIDKTAPIFRTYQSKKEFVFNGTSSNASTATSVFQDGRYKMKDRFGHENTGHGNRRNIVESGGYTLYGESDIDLPIGMSSSEMTAGFDHLEGMDLQDKLRIAENRKKYRVVINLDKNVAKFQGPVHKNMRIGTFFKSKVYDRKYYIYPYIAVTTIDQICKNCGDTTCHRDDRKWCEPKCFLVMCQNCKLYGHTKAQCHNNPSK